MGMSSHSIFDMEISKHSGYRDFAWAIELNRLGLELIGLWPGNDEVDKSTFASDLRVGIIFVIVTFASGIPLVCSLVRVWGDMTLMVDNLQITLPLLVVSLKLVIMRWKRSALMSVIKMMAEDWTDLRTAKERDVMIRYAQIIRAIVIGGFSLIILAFIVVAVLPYFGLILTRHLTNLTDSGRPLPLQTYYFYDTNKSPQFELTFIIQAVTIFLAAITYTSVDAFLGLILHFCGQLENFKGRIAVLVSCQNFIRALSNSVANHLRLVRFANVIEDTFALMMLGLVFYFGIVFCLHGFLLITVITEEGDLSFQRLCFPLIGISILFSHTFLYCGAGEIVTMQCERIYRAMCDLEWYNLEPKEAKALIILMIRANQPFRITAGKIFPLTMTTFCSLLKTSAGYISFLLAKRG